MEFLINNWAEISGSLALIIIAGSRIARLTPTSKDDAFFASLRKIGRVIGLDVPDRQ